MFLTEMKSSAAQFHTMQQIRKMFVRITNSKNWEEACVRFPEFTCQEKLQKFLSLDYRHGPPEVFRNYCDAALGIKCIFAGVAVQLDNGCSISVLHSAP